MLTVEEFKRCIEEFKPEGFSFFGQCELVTPTCIIGLKDKGIVSINALNKVYYPLFLQRVIEGINRDYSINKHDDPIFGTVKIFSEDIVTCSTGLKKVICKHFNFKDFENIDEAKEKAIKYILENV